MAWVRGVEPLPRETLDTFQTQSMDGAALLALTAERLATECRITDVGQQQAILLAVRQLAALPTYLAASPVSLLGAQLLQAGRNIDAQPLEAVASMMASLTAALETLDLHPPADREAYTSIRTTLLRAADTFLSQSEQLAVSLWELRASK